MSGKQKSELVAIYHLEFYRKQKHWKFPTENKKQIAAASKPHRSPKVTVAQRLLNQTYVVKEEDANTLHNQAFTETSSERNIPITPQNSPEISPDPEFAPKEWPQPVNPSKQWPDPEFTSKEWRDSEIMPTERPRPEFPLKDWPQQDFAPREWPNSEFTSNEWPQPAFTPRECPQPETPKQWLDPDFTPQVWSNPEFQQWPDREFTSMECPQPKLSNSRQQCYVQDLHTILGQNLSISKSWPIVPEPVWPDSGCGWQGAVCREDKIWITPRDWPQWPCEMGWPEESQVWVNTEYDAGVVEGPEDCVPEVEYAGEECFVEEPPPEDDQLWGQRVQLSEGVDTTDGGYGEYGDYGSDCSLVSQAAFMSGAHHAPHSSAQDLRAWAWEEGAVSSRTRSRFALCRGPPNTPRPSPGRSPGSPPTRDPGPAPPPRTHACPPSFAGDVFVAGSHRNDPGFDICELEGRGRGRRVIGICAGRPYRL